MYANLLTALKKLLLLTSLLSLCACATTGNNAEHDPDPLEPANRVVFGFNQFLDTYLLRPAAVGYQTVTPEFMQMGVSNFFSNLNEPRNILNNVLQLKLVDAASDTGRLLANSTFGIFGLVDVATGLGMEKSDEDFGQTLGYWGVGTGPYIVLPVFGASNVRDGFGRLADGYADPVYYVDDQLTTAGIKILDTIETRERLLAGDRLITDAFDPYLFLRDAYLQRREFLVHDGEVPEDMIEPFEEFEEFDDELDS